MYTKTITIKKTSCKGNEFECTMKIQCDSEEEKKAKYQQYLAEKRDETLRRQANELYEAEKALHPCRMSELEDIIDEFIRNVRDFDY